MSAIGTTFAGLGATAACSYAIFEGLNTSSEKSDWKEGAGVLVGTGGMLGVAVGINQMPTPTNSWGKAGLAAGLIGAFALGAYAGSGD